MLDAGSSASAFAYAATARDGSAVCSIAWIAGDAAAFGCVAAGACAAPDNINSTARREEAKSSIRTPPAVKSASG
jgi:hypothetical protein